MAKTAAGTELSEAHRAAQLAVRAGSLAELVKLWKIVDPADLSGTIDVFVRAAVLLAGQGFDRSAGTASRYYGLFRRVEGVAGAAPVGLAVRPPTAELAADLRGASLKGIIDARRAGLGIEQAKARGLVRAVGSLGKLVLAGGQRTIVTLVQRDPQALGYGRVTSGDPCAFCRMLAGRGATYKTEKSADFKPHDGCGCSAEPLFKGGKPPEQAAEYAREWNEAQRRARQDGTASTGTSNNALNNYRRFLAGEGTAAPSPVTEESG
jgi:hypothetical protein